MLCCVLCCFLFFQAEDGIRDLVRSRGLGDVYKRQSPQRAITRIARRVTNGNPRMRNGARTPAGMDPVEDDGALARTQQNHVTVSYTHLTLPTSDLV